MTTRFVLKNEGPGKIAFTAFSGRKKQTPRILEVGESVDGTVYKGQRFSIEEARPKRTSPPAE